MEDRVRKLNNAGIRPGGQYVLYWMRHNRRVQSNHALQFAASFANQLDLSLVCVETLTCCYPYANDRLHSFVLEGVAATAQALKKFGAGYVFDLAKTKDHPDRVQALARNAAAVVVDDYPETLAPRPGFEVQAFAVDSSCIVPAKCIPARSYAAYSMRPKIHKLLQEYLKPAPVVRLRNPVGTAWSENPEIPANAGELGGLAIDHSVAPSTLFRGGRKQAERRLDEFLEGRLNRYARDKNEPAAHATSELSPYLHFGYISALEIALRVHEYREEHKVVADEFLEELIVRRELAFNFAWHAKRLDSLGELPEWARETLRTHAKDARDALYSTEQFEAAATYDDLWNATQKELLLRGKIHGYYRMYWGKKILEWSKSPEEALQTMIYLHDKYALDGQDPNTYTNILWCFGLHDRPWPERPVYGTVRSMSRAGMDRKTDVQAYIREIEYVQRTGKELAT